MSFGSPLSFVVGIVASLLVQWLKTNNSKLTAWITPGHTKTVQALVGLLSCAAGLLMASTQPGGLASLDWKTVLQEAGGNASVVLTSMIVTYHWLIAPHEKAPAAAKVAPAPTPPKK